MPPPSLALLKQKYLWSHQVKAVRLVQRYLKARRAGTTSGSALVRFPTGTGKTAVIAVAARILAPAGIVVVVCPSAALRDQLSDEISTVFWEKKLGVEPPQPGLRVEVFTPSSLAGTLASVGTKSAVLVGTIQALAEVRKDHPSDFSGLAAKISLLVFDEGHREPATVWGDAARALQAPTLLFSATPYRNDYALFDVDPKYVESLPFHEAIQDRCIREVRVERIGFNGVDEFITEFIQVLKKEPAQARAIVRCQTRDSITRVVTALNGKGLSAIGIHDGYTAADGSIFMSGVPLPSREHARIWVHQFKLLEGIDDPRFSVVAIFDPFSNARSLVQQVGRVIRNPSRKLATPATLVVHEDHGQERYWAAYLEFEKFYDPAANHDVRDFLLKTLDGQPRYRYLGDTFRSAFDPSAADFAERLRVPRSANVYKLRGAWSPDDLLSSIVKEWEEGDRMCLNHVQVDADTIVVLYADARNSPVLLHDYFIEARIGFTLVHRAKEWLFYLDTNTGLSESVLRIAAPLPGPTMHRLFGAATRPVAMSMRNTDLGRHAFRYRSVRAYSLADTSTGLSDHGYLCSTAEGYDKSPDLNRDIRRYVGIARGKLTETSPPNHDLRAFQKWAASKVGVLTASGNSPQVFDRFAASVAPPSDTNPRHLLLDIAELVASDAFRSSTGDELRIDELAVPVDANGRCTIVANDTRYEMGVTYDQARQRYRLSADELDGAYTRGDAADRLRRGIVQQLNVDQSFRVVPGEGWVIYAHGHFVQPATGVGKSAKKGLDLLRVLTEVPALATTTSEKGEAGSASLKDGWSATSVFGLVDRCGRQTGAPPNAGGLVSAMAGLDIIVCDDMDKETADFICGGTSTRRVVMVHAKQKDSKRSASAFHDVCSQAMKNLRLLVPFKTAPPANLKRWDKPWEAHDLDAKASIGKVIRIRQGMATGKECWDGIQELLRAPDTEREVWIVLGKTFSIRWLRAQVEKNDPAPEAVQLFYLLQSTWASVSSIGAKLRVFASDR